MQDFFHQQYQPVFLVSWSITEKFRTTGKLPTYSGVWHPNLTNLGGDVQHVFFNFLPQNLGKMFFLPIWTMFFVFIHWDASTTTTQGFTLMQIHLFFAHKNLHQWKILQNFIRKKLSNHSVGWNMMKLFVGNVPSIWGQLIPPKNTRSCHRTPPNSPWSPPRLYCRVSDVGGTWFRRFPWKISVLGW